MISYLPIGKICCGYIYIYLIMNDFRMCLERCNFTSSDIMQELQTISLYRQLISYEILGRKIFWCFTLALWTLGGFLLRCLILDPTQLLLQIIWPQCIHIWLSLEWKPLLCFPLTHIPRSSSTGCISCLITPSLSFLLVSLRKLRNETKIAIFSFDAVSSCVFFFPKCAAVQSHRFRGGFRADQQECDRTRRRRLRAVPNQGKR